MPRRAIKNVRSFCEACLLRFRIFVGLVNGIVLRYALSEDMNKMDMTGNFHGHTHTVTSVIYSPADNMLFTCSRDKSLSWFTTDREINVKLGTVFMSF